MEDEGYFTCCEFVVSIFVKLLRRVRREKRSINFLFSQQNDKLILAGTFQGCVKMLNLHTGAVSMQ